MAELEPGLLRFLSHADASGVPLGEGGAFAWTVPIGAAATAAYAVLEPVAGVNLWTGVKNTVRFHRCARADEVLVAACRLSGLGALGETAYRVWSRERGDLVVEGTFLSVPAAADAQGLYATSFRETLADPTPARTASAPATATKGGAPPALDAWLDPAPRTTTDADLARLQVWTATAPERSVAGEPDPPAVVVLRRPRVMRAFDEGEERVWEWHFPGDLLRLLLHPLAGGTQPLGRRHHPFGRMLEGLAIHASLAMTDGTGPVELATRLVQPLRGDDDLRVRARVRPAGAALARVDHEIYEGERPVARVRVSVPVIGGAVKGATT